MSSRGQQYSAQQQMKAKKKRSKRRQGSNRPQPEAPSQKENNIAPPPSMMDPPEGEPPSLKLPAVDSRASRGVAAAANTSASVTSDVQPAPAPPVPVQPAAPARRKITPKITPGSPPDLASANSDEIYDEFMSVLSQPSPAKPAGGTLSSKLAEQQQLLQRVQEEEERAARELAEREEEQLAAEAKAEEARAREDAARREGERLERIRVAAQAKATEELRIAAARKAESDRLERERVEAERAAAVERRREEAERAEGEAASAAAKDKEAEDASKLREYTEWRNAERSRLDAERSAGADRFDVAQNAYGLTKSVWAWGKTVPVVESILSISEHVASELLDRAAHTTLPAIDREAISPQLKKLDDDVLSPAISMVWKMIEPVVSRGEELVVKPVLVQVVPRVLGVLGQKEQEKERDMIDSSPTPEVTPLVPYH